MGTSDSPAKGRNLLVISNRLPVSIKRDQENGGKYKATVSGGGLVSSLSGLTGSVKFHWFGWPGMEIPDDEKGNVRDILAEHDAVPLFLPQKLADDHYNGFSNSTIWPVFHYQTTTLYFHEEWWDAYQEVNRRFSVQVADAASDGDLIWVHDYHLMLLPELLRTELANRGKTARIGFSLHTPFPVADVYRTLPTSHQLLEGLLSSDLIGFHTDHYAEHFVGACTSILNLHANNGVVHYQGRSIKTGKFIVGINPQRFHDALQSRNVISRIRELEKNYEGMKTIVGVDRLDYIKGIPQKLNGLDQFLQENPEWVGKIVLIQIAVPSRENVQEYKDLEEEVSKQVGEVNGKYGTIDYTPVVFVHKSVSFDELTALYATSDLCLLTPTRDGMNLVAAEYVACQETRHGVLMLSEFAGASAYLGGGCIQFNPSNKFEISDAIHRAVTMNDKDREAYYEEMFQFVNQHTSQQWGKRFVEELRDST